ncbi:BON domain-containing protein [bacterium]|nr:BON domain-containing protein [bacterium]
MKMLKKNLLRLFVLAAPVALMNYAEASGSSTPKDQTLANLHTEESQIEGSASDVKLTRKIRSLITDDDSLSVAAHNVRIVTSNGNVTLKGQVKNENEKVVLERHARTFALTSTISNELKVSPDSKDY